MDSMNEIIFKPRVTNIVRYNLIGNLMGVPIGVGLTIFFVKRLSTFSLEDTLLLWLAASSTGILVGLLVQLLILKKLLEVLTITISARHIVGPWGWQRKSFETGRLDRARSRHRNLYQRLVGSRSLLFQDGEKLKIYDPYYGKEQIQTLLEVLQLRN